MKNKNYFLGALLSGALMLAGTTGFAQKAVNLQDNGSPAQVVSGTTSGIDRIQNVCDTLITTFAAGNGNSGVMFNVVGKQHSTVNYFTVNTQNSVATDSVRIYTRLGTCIGHDASATGWTLASTMFVKEGGTTTDTLIVANSTPLNFDLPAGDTMGVYITYTQGSITMAYTNGTAVDSVYRQDLFIKVLQDYGISYPFAGTFSPRIFNGIVDYCPVITGVNEVGTTNVATLYPNPVSSASTLQISGNISLDNLKLVITDVSGRTVMTQDHFASHNVTINKGNLSSGMYFYTLMHNNTFVGNGKMMVQ